MSKYRTCQWCGCYLPDGEIKCRACGEYHSSPGGYLYPDKPFPDNTSKSMAYATVVQTVVVNGVEMKFPIMKERVK